jgi:hypothetical protein
MPKPPYTFVHLVRSTKSAAQAKDSKNDVALNDVALARGEVIHSLLRQARMDRKRLAEIRSLIEDAKKGKIGDEKRRALGEGIEQLSEIAEQIEKIREVEAWISVPAHDVIRTRTNVPPPGPNYATGLAEILALTLVFDRLLCGKHPKQS